MILHSGKVGCRRLYEPCQVKTWQGSFHFCPSDFFRFARQLGCRARAAGHPRPGPQSGLPSLLVFGVRFGDQVRTTMCVIHALVEFLEYWVASVRRDFDSLPRVCSGLPLLCVAVDEIVLAPSSSCEQSLVNAPSISMGRERVQPCRELAGEFSARQLCARRNHVGGGLASEYELTATDSFRLPSFLHEVCALATLG